MNDLIVIGIIVIIISLASYKVYRDKKNGVKCSGCSHSKECNAEDGCGN